MVRLSLPVDFRCALEQVASIWHRTHAYSIAIEDRKMAIIGTSLLVLTGLMVLLQWMISVRASCPLCMTPVLGNKECVKHRSAKTLLGSHRLRVALAVLFLNRFRCPYCGESCEVKARVRRAS